jgi:hypothetical protein
MPMPLAVNLQLHHDGSWTTFRDAKGKPVVYPLTRATLKAGLTQTCNWRLVYVTDGATAVTKLSAEAMLHIGIPATRDKPARPVRPVIRKPSVGLLARVGKVDRSAHVQSWFSKVVRA